MSERQDTEEIDSNIIFWPSGEEELARHREESDIQRGEKIRLAEEQKSLAEILKAAGKEVPDEARIDVYNPSIIFKHKGKEYIAGRVELSGKAAEHDSLTVFFKRDGEKWLPLAKPVFELQDPNITWVDREMILSGIEVLPDEQREGWVKYRMVFYKGKDFEDLSKFSEGPWGMKGIRLTELSDGKIGIYTRPQGGEAGLGQIGFTSIENLDEISGDELVKIATEASLLKYRFPEGEWGGVNQVIPLSDGKNLVIGHRAYRDDRKNRHYFPWACLHDPYTGEVIDLGILSERGEFANGPAKAPDLRDVLYTAGIIKREGKWFLIVGLSDTQAGMIGIKDPLARLESVND